MDTTELVVRQMRWESHDVMSVRLEKSDGSALAAWTPGAHLDIHLGPSLIRQYSLCGDPDDKTGYRIAVLKDPASRGGSKHVHEQLRPGQLVAVSEPRNNFELIDAPHYMFIAGGIGITPILSMIREVDRRGASWELHYGGRSKRGMAFLDEIAEFHGAVDIVCEDSAGMLNLPDLLTVPRPDALVYTCGPEGLLGAVESHGAGWPDGSIRLERFKPKVADPIAAGGDRSVRVVCSRSGISAVVAPHASILDTLEGAGLDLPNSCREGMCGSCETPVLEGIPDHRDSVLSAAEQSSGKTMMICVSRARTDELVLDL